MSISTFKMSLIRSGQLLKMPRIHLLLYAAISIGSLYGSDMSWVIDLSESRNTNYLRNKGTELVDLATCKQMANTTYSTPNSGQSFRN